MGIPPPQSRLVVASEPVSCLGIDTLPPLARTTELAGEKKGGPSLT